LLPTTADVVELPFNVSPPEKVAAPARVSTSLAPSVCATAVDIPLTVRALPLSDSAFPVRLTALVPVAESRSVFALLATCRPTLLPLLITGDAPLNIRLDVADAPFHCRPPEVPVVRTVPVPLIVKLVALDPPRLNVSPDAIVRLPKVAVPPIITPAVPVMVTVPKVCPYGVIV
jgi:hypothetical protein